MKRFVIYLLFALSLLVPLFGIGSASAQDRSVTVESRNGEFTILENGDVRVREVWRVRFSGGPFRFAFRSIPLNRVEDITNWSVREDEQDYRPSSTESANTYKLETVDNERKLTWYFSPTTSASRTFVLEYTLKGALRIYDDGDQFFWKFIESDRGYTIQSSEAVVKLPASFQSNQLKTQTYLNSAPRNDEAQIVDGSTVKFKSISNFIDGEEWEIRVQFPHGVVPSTPPAWQARDDAIRAMQPFYDMIALVGSGLIALLGGIGLYMLWFFRGRDKPAGVVAEFYAQPPDDAPPGVAGTLVDERADMREVIATMVDLARRGFLVIEEQQTEGFMGMGGSTEFRFQRTNADRRELLDYERLLLDKLFGNKGSRDLSDLRNEFHTALEPIKNALYEQTVKHGYFRENPNSTRTKYGCMGVVMLIASGACGFFGYGMISEYAPLAILVVFALGAVALGFTILSMFMPQRTQAGSTANAKWLAFKRYLERVDKYTNVEQAKEQFNKYLPYAIAFGVEREWVSRFEKVNTPAPDWYYPHGYGQPRPNQPFVGPGNAGPGRVTDGPSLDNMSRGAFNSLNTMSAGLFTMLNTTSSIFASTPSESSSGGSSGGFSGGGGGGGGSSGFG